MQPDNNVSSKDPLQSLLKAEEAGGVLSGMAVEALPKLAQILDMSNALHKQVYDAVAANSIASSKLSQVIAQAREIVLAENK